MPGNQLELQAVDEERFTAAALFGLAGSQAGAQLLLQQDSPVLQGIKQSINCVLSPRGQHEVNRLSSHDGILLLRPHALAACWCMHSVTWHCVGTRMLVR